MIKVLSIYLLAITQAPNVISYIIKQVGELLLAEMSNLMKKGHGIGTLKKKNYDFLSLLGEEENYLVKKKMSKQLKKIKNQLLWLHQINLKKVQVTKVQVRGYAVQGCSKKSMR